MQLKRLFKRKPREAPPQGRDASGDGGLTTLPASGKLGRIKRRIRKEMIMSGLVILGLAPATYGVSLWDSGTQESRDTLTREVNTKSNEILQAEQRNAHIENSMRTYDLIMRNNKNGEIPLDRQQAKELIQKRAEKTALASLRLSMAPVTVAQDVQFNNNVYEAQSCEIQLNLDALSDEHVLAFVAALKDTLPGRIKITALNMTRQAEVTPETLSGVEETGKGGLVKSEIKMVWYGMKLKQPAGEGAPK